MKKKGLLIFAVTAVLTLGTGAFSAFAASSGWKSLDGSWVYYDSYGSTVTNQWKKGADEKWRYLDSSGYMAVSSWVDEFYYVDSNGLMVTDQWLQLDSSYNEETEEPHWYYFGSSGKAVIDTWKKISGKWYCFDTDGAMQTGWVDEDMYFCGDDGAAKIGWHKLYPPDDDYEEDRTTPDSEEDDGKNWYYFANSGKKFVPDLSAGAEYGEKKIESTYYCFDESGAMQTGWVYVGSGTAENGSIEDCRYYGTDGKVKTGWYSAEPPEFISGYEDEVEWFYFSKSGVPESGDDEEEPSVSDFMKVNNKTYLFNEIGNPLYGLQKVYTSDTDYTAYYFGDKKASSMQKGKHKVEESDGTVSDFYFSETGRGYTGVKSNYLYYMGKLQRAEDGTRYQIISLPTGNKYVNYLVNTSGKVIKSSSGVKDADGVKYTTSSTGVVLKIDDEVIGDGYFESASEPAWFE